MLSILLSLNLILTGPVVKGIDGSLWDEPITASAVAVRTVEHRENLEVQDGWSVPDWARCPQYWPTAQAAGFTLDQMPKVDYIMHRESTCYPYAHNPSGASGLVQWMPMWFNGGNSYGWKFDPFDPYQSLYHMRLRVNLVGWHDWCLRGDPVTGSC